LPWPRLSRKIEFSGALAVDRIGIVAGVIERDDLDLRHIGVRQG